MPQETKRQRSDVIQGTLGLIVLKTLEVIGPLHGYGIACRVEQISQAALQPNQGTIYASLVRLQQKGWISASWGVSANNRKAKFYALTPRGRRELTREMAGWERIAGVIGRLLALKPGAVDG
jgi:PadR family transcriptional regulator, regulatory protein PadR